MESSEFHYNETENMSMDLFSQADSNFWAPSEQERDSFMAGDTAILDYEPSVNGSRIDALADRYSTKVFIGGIPLGTTEAFLRQCFGVYDLCDISWPGKKNFRDSPPNGYCFVQFRHNEAVRALLNTCGYRDGKYCFSLGKRRDLVQIRPWRLADSTYTVSEHWSRFVRLSVFVGGLPRTLKASELFELVQTRFGNVLHCSMELEFESSYPKGAARVIFSSIDSYRACASTGHVEHQWYPNRHYNVSYVEFKPFVYKNIECENCGNSSLRTEFCTAKECLIYYCRLCFNQVHQTNPLFADHQVSKAVPRDLPNPCRAEQKAKQEKAKLARLANLDFSRPPPAFVHSSQDGPSSSFDTTNLDESLKENEKSTEELVKENIEKRPRKFGNLLQSYGVDL
ncbi:unnamed protein product [Bursaphelenchus xylophilus]|uniref:(pine wood nematode) hypothetical protein n=1 Tax=Bursaphelenchus xylophilus TaxID=6326 RepID=A0A1I7RWL9_BURXY|nr:unnamed protein product [Bursaphelenchus xylophilus]CAG9128484.1 unnamed protein product [Bursaphelenchus xylophilus]